MFMIVPGMLSIAQRVQLVRSVVVLAEIVIWHIDPNENEKNPKTLKSKSQNGVNKGPNTCLMWDSFVSWEIDFLDPARETPTEANMLIYLVVMATSVAC